jgi:hypothetical protein
MLMLFVIAVCGHSELDIAFAFLCKQYNTVCARIHTLQSTPLALSARLFCYCHAAAAAACVCCMLFLGRKVTMQSMQSYVWLCTLHN